MIVSTRDNRGGARNSASRESFALTEHQVGNILKSSEHALRIGLPFTRFITVHWKAAGISLEAMVMATGRFLDIVSKALARHGTNTAWVYVHENGIEEGWHCHILMHLPAAMVEYASRRQLRWIRSITGQPYRSRSIKSRIIGGRLGIEVTSEPLHQQNLAVLLGYVVKQADEQATRRFGLTRVVPPGSILGKRAGTSQNIGVTARQRYKQA